MFGMQATHTGFVGQALRDQARALSWLQLSLNSQAVSLKLHQIADQPVSPLAVQLSLRFGDFRWGSDGPASDAFLDLL